MKEGDDCKHCNGIGTIVEGKIVCFEKGNWVFKHDRDLEKTACTQCFNEFCQFCKINITDDSCMMCNKQFCDQCAKKWYDMIEDKTYGTNKELTKAYMYGDHCLCFDCGHKLLTSAKQ